MRYTTNDTNRLELLNELKDIDMTFKAERAALRAEYNTLAKAASADAPKMQNFATYNEYAEALFEHNSLAAKLTFARKRLEDYETNGGVSVFPASAKEIYWQYKAANNLNRAAIVNEYKKSIDAVIECLDRLQELAKEDDTANNYAHLFKFISPEDRDIKSARETIERVRGYYQ